jgi:hypothetical protein
MMRDMEVLHSGIQNILISVAGEAVFFLAFFGFLLKLDKLCKDVAQQEIPQSASI